MIKIFEYNYLFFKESSCSTLQLKKGILVNPKAINIIEKPIAKKYCEGKVKRTLRKESKDMKSL